MTATRGTNADTKEIEGKIKNGSWQQVWPIPNNFRRSSTERNGALVLPAEMNSKAPCTA